MPPFSSPLLLGFDAMEKTLERLAKTGNSYPPYNIERIRGGTTVCGSGSGSRSRLPGLPRTISRITVEENQLVRARPAASKTTEREFLHRGIAARQFQRCFVLADGMRSQGASSRNGLLAIDLDRPEPERLVRKINISVKD